MYYTVHHVTKFVYEVPISESVMEVRMQPLTDSTQRCLQFGLSTNPSATVMAYRDHENNLVHHFDIPGRHNRLTLTAQALVECLPPSPVPDRLGENAWQRLDDVTARGELWELLNPSPFVVWTPALEAFAREVSLARDDDPLVVLRRLNRQIYDAFEYSPRSTRVDSPIDEALEARRGVCQDFTHIFIALVRRLRVPCRYVSGYLFHQVDAADRSSDGATHAWAEVWLPDLGWVGFDPTNDLLAGERHIRVAVGRDYADVPPTRGVYRGISTVRSELMVGVTVGTASPSSVDALPLTTWTSHETPMGIEGTADASEQQQQ